MPTDFETHHDAPGDTPHEAESASDAAPVVYRTRQYARSAPPPPPPPPQESALRRRQKQRVTGGTPRPTEWLWVLAAAAMFGLVIFIGVSAFLFTRASQAEGEIVPTAEVAELLPTPLVVRNEFSLGGQVDVGDRLFMPDGSAIEIQPWDGQSRFTMIAVGLDRRPNETGLGYRTDTMMLVSINPQTQSVGVLSIPRDLYVQVPGYSRLQRINAPMVLGESRREGYGPTLMMQTVQLNLGIRVHDYVAVDFQTFIDVVDAIGGIEVTIDYNIRDPRYPDMNYGYDPFYLDAGTHQLMGYDALRFARTRHGDSDIRRAERQQQALYAIRDKILSAEMVPQLIAQAPGLYQSLQDNFYTGLSFEQLLQLALYVKDIPLENITMDVIDFSYLQSYTTEDGWSVLIPNRARLGGLMVDTFGPDYSQ